MDCVNLDTRPQPEPDGCARNPTDCETSLDPETFFDEDQLDDIDGKQLISCFSDTLESIFEEALVLVLVNVSLKLLFIYIKHFFPEINSKYCKIMLGIGGQYIMFRHFRDHIHLGLYFSALCFIGMQFLQYRPKKGEFIWALGFVAIAINEFLVYTNYDEFTRLRVFLMCMVMKLVAVRDQIIIERRKMEKHNDSKKRLYRPSYYTLFAYLFDPASIPFCSFTRPAFEYRIGDLVAGDYRRSAEAGLLPFCIY